MKKVILLVFCIILNPLTTFAEIEKISIVRAVEIAMQNNLELKAKQKDYEIQKQEIKIANALKNPQIQSNVLIGEVSRGNFNQFGLSLPVEVLKRGVRKKAQTTKLKKIEQEIHAFEHELKIKVLKSYFEVLYMKSILKVQKELADFLEATEKITKTKTKSINYEADVLQSDIKLTKQQVLINRTKSQLLIAQLAFNDSLNLKDDSTMYDTLEDSLFDDNVEILNINLPDYSVIECAAMQYSYSIKLADINIEFEQNQLKNQKNNIIPDLNLNAGLAHQPSYSQGHSKTGIYLGVGFDLPVLYQYKPEINKAQRIIEKSKISKESYESHLKIALKQNYNQFKYSKENMEYYQTILEDSANVLKIYKEKYKKGQITLFNLLQIERVYREVVSDYLLVMHRFFSAYLDLMLNVGHDILLDDDAL